MTYPYAKRFKYLFKAARRSRLEPRIHITGSVLVTLPSRLAVPGEAFLSPDSK
jgi:hypothetical protein